MHSIWRISPLDSVELCVQCESRFQDIFVWMKRVWSISQGVFWRCFLDNGQCPLDILDFLLFSKTVSGTPFCALIYSQIRVEKFESNKCANFSGCDQFDVIFGLTNRFLTKLLLKKSLIVCVQALLEVMSWKWIFIAKQHYPE